MIVKHEKPVGSNSAQNKVLWSLYSADLSSHLSSFNQVQTHSCKELFVRHLSPQISCIVQKSLANCEGKLNFRSISVHQEIIKTHLDSWGSLSEPVQDLWVKLIAEEDRTCWLAQIGIFSWSIQSLQPCRRLITYYSIFIHQELLQRNSNMISKKNLESNICVRLNNSQNKNRVVGGREHKK